ncbi:type VI secretion system baseplate subunit TssK [Martelella alba]|uniref:Type VI secretion system baseplate subunit TssK n=1 Tax=Martelella alba TaxID=2590451 RepID=A0ABY2SIR9_9HYPH|nr:type VI secretion system baseplate subunit TssK [Martelella alba]TKI04329.1 type VI secretion system baseplate subunit TssK [Martelella alba]
MIKKAHKVLWTEGMFLRPHHFQQAEAYLEERQWRLRPGGYCFGFSALSLDEGLAALGKIALTSAEGVFADGTVFHIAGPEEGPAPLDIGAEHDGQTIVLAVPVKHAGRDEAIFCDLPDSPARYRAFEKDVADNNAVSAGNAVLYCGKLRLRLMPERELSGDWLSLGVARVKQKTPDGAVVLDEDYIPPLINSDASPVLCRFRQELTGLLRQRRRQLGRYLQQCAGGRETAVDLHLLGLIHRFGAIAEHTLTLPRLHPERLFAEWLPFALELAVSRPPYQFEGDMPRYDHLDIGGAFGRLMMRLRQGLFFILQENAVPLALTRQMPGLSVAVLPESGMIGNYDFVLAVQADLRTDDASAHFLAQVKIAPAGRIRDLVQLQLPGITLRCLFQAPRQLAAQPGWSYIELQGDHAMWQDIDGTGTIAVHVAGEFGGVPLALWAVRRLSGAGEADK